VYVILSILRPATSAVATAVAWSCLILVSLINIPEYSGNDGRDAESNTICRVLVLLPISRSADFAGVPEFVNAKRLSCLVVA
jgi:hypothetical protein